MRNPRKRHNGFFPSGAIAALLLPAALLCAPPTAQAQMRAPALSGTEPAAIAPVPLEDVSRAIDGPTLVSLHLKDTPFQQAFEQLAQQASLPADVSNPDVSNPDWFGGKPTVTLDIERQPFWLAVHDLAVAGKVTRAGGFGAGRPGRQRRVGPADLLAGPAAPSGPFLFVATRLTNTRTLKFDYADPATHDDTRRLRFDAAILADPKLHVLGYSPDVQIDEAVDELGHSLIDHGIVPPEQRRYRAQRSFEMQMVYNLALPSDGGHRIARLRGHFNVIDSPQVQLWEIPDPLHAQGATITVRRNDRDVVYTLTSAETKNISSTFQVTAEPAAGQPYPFPLANPFGGPPRGEDGQIDGAYHTMWLDSEEENRERGNALARPGAANVLLTHTFFRERRRRDAPLVDPAKLTVEIPTGLRIIEVPFEFKDLAID